MVRDHGRSGYRPDACLVDADLPGGGLTAVSEIIWAHPQAVVVVLADRHSDANLLDLVRAGATGYLDKDIPPDSLPSVIRAALAGERSSLVASWVGS